ncbi:MAG: hemerythrin domain-containing protein [Candidatus Polarisedimenticolaceae bacterium]|nr:hemerythrin domain-containing protein [Candidatus Polarisedimenticolaceae bacterium]
MFFGLFGNNEKSKTQTKLALPGTEIYYHPHLVNDLLSDHVELLKMFGKIDAAHKKGNVKQTIQTLNDFTESLRSHLIIENTKLYIYLRHSLRKMPSEAKVAQGFQHEMRSIGKALNEFVTEFSSDSSWSEKKRKAFGEQLSAIGDILIQRIETEEESLYPLYNEPNHLMLRTRRK